MDGIDPSYRHCTPIKRGVSGRHTLANVFLHTVLRFFNEQHVWHDRPWMASVMASVTCPRDETHT